LPERKEVLVVRQKTTCLRNNDRAILNAYASQCLSDSIHSIEQATAAVAQSKPLSVILLEQRKNMLANKNTNS
jgi:hypothetical protein